MQSDTFSAHTENMWFVSNIQAIGTEQRNLFNRMFPAASCLTCLCHFSSYASSFSLLYETNPHKHTHTQGLSHSLRLEYISWWPRQVTDGDLTALLTVNWVLIKPKHVWEMLIIHCRLKESSLENIVTMHVHPWFILIFPTVIISPFTASQLGSVMQDGFGVLSIPGYFSPQAVSLNKINIDKNLTNSNLTVLKVKHRDF